MAFQPGPHYQGPPPRAAKKLSERPWLIVVISVAASIIVMGLIVAIAAPKNSGSDKPQGIADPVAKTSARSTDDPQASASAASSSAAAASSAAASSSAAAQASSAAAAASSAAAAQSSAAAAASEAAAQALIAACGTWNADYLWTIMNNNPSITRATQAAWEATWAATQPATCAPTAAVSAALATARATAARLEDAANRPVAAPPTYSNGGGSGGGSSGGGGGGGGSSLGNPGNSKNCSDFSTHAQAQAWFETYYPLYGDVAGLDADNDMSACETLP